MADLHDRTENNQEVSQDFNTRSGVTQGSVMNNTGKGGGGASEKLRQTNVEFNRISYMNLLQIKEEQEKAIRELKNSRENYFKKKAEHDKKIKEYEDIIAQDRRQYGEKVKASVAQEVDRAKKALEEEKKTWEEKRKEQLTHIQHLQNSTRKYREGTKYLEDTYNITVDYFESMQKFVEDQQAVLNQTKEAMRMANAAMRKNVQKLHVLQDELNHIDISNTEERKKKADEIRAVREEQGELNSTFLRAQAEKRAAQRNLWAEGLNEDGSARSRNEAMARGVEDFATGFGADFGAEIGSAFGPVGAVIGTLAGTYLGGKASGESTEETMASMGEASENISLDLVPESLEPILSELGPIGEVVQIADNILEVCGELRKLAKQYIDNAVQQLNSYYGVIVANLENSAFSMKAISEKADNILSVNRFVKQTDYLSKIADLSNQGLLRDIETAAILETIKNKTLSSFDATNEGLRRLIRLNETDYIRQYGIEMQLKRALNSVFNDSGYLQSMFDQVTSAIADVSVKQSGDLTAFNSTVQTWMGYMYASGLSSGVIDSLVKGINALGSGNIQELTGDEQTQRLFLLAMDRIGMDYADVLQQGLSLNDTNSLLASIVQYLDEITTSTSKNNVLQSSYASLFNLSVADMQAIHQLSSKTSSIYSNIINTGEAWSITRGAMSNTLSQATTTAEKFDNLIANLQYTYGESIAENTALYAPYRIAEETINILNPIADVGGVVGKVAKTAQRVAAAAELPVMYIGYIKTLYGDLLPSILNAAQPGSALEGFLSSSLSTSISNAEGALNALSYSSSSGSNTASTTNNIKSVGGKAWMSNMLQTNVASYSSEEDLTAEEESTESKILKEMAKTLMKTKEEGHYAFAVSLEGMNDNVLRSFASIFADEDAMKDTFTGDNKAIQDSLFNYLDDGTSNTAGTEASTGANAAATAAATAATTGATTSATQSSGSKTKKNKNKKKGGLKTVVI